EQGLEADDLAVRITAAHAQGELRARPPADPEDGAARRAEEVRARLVDQRGDVAPGHPYPFSQEKEPPVVVELDPEVEDVAGPHEVEREVALARRNIGHVQ